MHAKATGVPIVLILCLLIIGLGAQGRYLSAQNANPQRIVVSDVELLGQASIPIGLVLDDTEIGGLSALTYDPQTDVYYVLSDDRSERDPARYYAVSIDLSNGTLNSGDVTFDEVTTLRQPNNQPFPPGGIDAEGIALSVGGTLFISSEGALLNLDPVQPFVNEFDLNGRQVREFALPAKFLSDTPGAAGIRNNLSFESLTLSPSARYVYTAVENALVQDGPEADLGITSLARLVKFDRISGTAVGEAVYPVGPALSSVSGDVPHGLTELISLDNNGTFLTLERGPSPGFGLSVRLYQARAQGALDVSAVDDLLWDDGGVVYDIDNLVEKELLLDLAELGLPFVNNFEGMTLGPVLPDGRQTLILVSDNNFSIVPTEFIALALTLETVPAAMPTSETPLIHDDGDAPAGILPGESADPAIWLHPDDPSQSIVALALKNGGLITLNMAGEVLQRVEPESYGDVRFTNADVIYNFPLGTETADLVIVSDGQGDRLEVFRIDPETRDLTAVTSAAMPGTLFGPDDGVQTVNRLAIYTSPRDGTVYALVSQASGNLVAQVRLAADDDGQVYGTVVRMLELPVGSGTKANLSATSIAVDRFFGHLYVGVDGGEGILKFDAEPDGGNDFVAIDTSAASDSPLEAGGLAIYYGPGSTGYLLATDPNDQSIAIFKRSDNAYVGRFVVPDEGNIDQVNHSGGLELINFTLGSSFPNGLLIVQDGANDPQSVIADSNRLRNISSGFKFVGWDAVANAFPNKLLIETNTYNPRQPMRILLPMMLRN